MSNLVPGLGGCPNRTYNTKTSPNAVPASKFRGKMGAKHFSGGRPSKRHRFWPLCTGKCPFFYDFSESWGARQHFRGHLPPSHPLAPPLSPNKSGDDCDKLVPDWLNPVRISSTEFLWFPATLVHWAKLPRHRAPV